MIQTQKIQSSLNVNIIKYVRHIHIYIFLQSYSVAFAHTNFWWGHNLSTVSEKKIVSPLPWGTKKHLSPSQEGQKYLTQIFNIGRGGGEGANVYCPILEEMSFPVDNNWILTYIDI